MRMRSAELALFAIPQNDTACEIEQSDSLLPAFAFRFGCLASFSCRPLQLRSRVASSDDRPGI